ncbi:MAG: glycosyl transferase [Hungatella sp.]|nr:glycosyl transferase [Hungatella sp.]
MAIPKVIHYFWFGKKELPELAKRCLESWKKFCPDYEIKLWNEENFDIHCIPFVEQAYEAKKFAFVTDYARFFILYKEGGVYIETDTELLKPIDRFLNDGMFLGIGKDDVTVCVFGMEKHHPLAQAVLDYYKERPFTYAPNVYDMTTVNVIIHKILIDQFGFIHKNKFQRLKGNICMYPTKFFLTDWTYGGLNHKESVAFHYADGSWLTPELREQKRILLKCVKLFGKRAGWRIGNVLYYLKYHGLKLTVKKCFEKLK